MPVEVENAEGLLVFSQENVGVDGRPAIRPLTICLQVQVKREAAVVHGVESLEGRRVA